MGAMKRALTEIELKECADLKAIFMRVKKATGLTQDVAANAIGFQTQGAVSQYLNGRTALNLPAALRFASLLKCDVADFSPRLAEELAGHRRSASVKTEGDKNHSRNDNVRPLGTRQSKKLPLISWVTAGMMRDAEDAYPVGHAQEWMESPFPHGEHAFLLTVEGDSMFHPDGSGYAHGEIIQVEPQKEAGHGSDVVVRTPDGKATFKRYKVGPDGPYLEALNPHWPERIIKVPEGTVICGVVVGSWRKRG